MSADTRYKILDKIGAGSFATVYRARDLELGREVAIKQVHDEYLADPGRLDRYWQEAQLLASLQHPNIVTIFDIVRERGWLVMELMQGNLGDRLQGKQMDLRALRSMLAQVLRALKYLHSQGIIHGDIKPGNLMLDPRRRVKLGDFGLARRASDETGSLLKGTTKYMAPEMVSEDFGDVGPASDLYSLGFTAYDLMCGPNFDQLFPGLNAFGRNKQIAWMMWHAAVDRQLPEITRVLTGVPDDLAKVVQKLTQKDQTKRYKTADEALSDLQIDLRVVGASDDQSTQEAPPATDRKRLYLAAGALAVSVVMCAAMLFWPSGKPATVTQNVTRGIVRSVGESALVIDDIESAVPAEYKVTDKPKIFLQNDQKNILLRELKPGDFIDVSTAKENPRLALSMTVDRPVDSRGSLKTMDLGGANIVVSLEEGNLRDELPLRVPPNIPIRLNGEKSKLNDLQVGDALRARHLSEPGVKKGRVLIELTALRPVTTIGYIAGIDADARELTLEIGRGPLSSRKKLSVAGNCQVTLNGSAQADGRNLSAADLKPGDRVSLEHDAEIHQIAATRQLQADGVIDEVDATGKSITILSTDGKRQTLAITPQSEVTLSLVRISVVELRRFDDVRASYAAGGDGQFLATTVDARRPSQRDRYGVVIGTQSYADPGLSPLKTANDDARRIHRALVERYALAEDRCALLIDAAQSEWRKQIADHLHAATKPMQVIISISGHAYVGEDGKVYLAARDFDFSRMAETGLPLDWLAEQLNACAAQDKLLLLDISPEGTGRDIQQQLAGKDLLAKLTVPLQKTVVITACSAGEHSQHSPAKKAGAFAWATAQGFQGAADANRDLHLTPTELFAYLQRELPGLGTSAMQTPTLIEPSAP